MILMASSEPKHAAFMHQLLRYIADYVDSHGSWAGARTNGLDLPVSRASVRARAVHPSIVSAVVSAASSGNLGRSSSSVCKSLLQVAHNKGLLRSQTGQKWSDPTVGREAMARWAMMRAQRACYYSVALDATRLDGAETLYFAVNMPELHLSGWSPQQAPVVSINTSF